MSTAIVDAALEWLARGCAIIPIPPPRQGVPAGQPGDGKVPAIAWRPYQQQLPSADQVRQWFGREEPMNLAVITGAISGVVVIDADNPDALRWCTAHLPYTPWQTKTARGYHLFYRCPADIPVRNRSRIETRDGRLAIDVRGDGGYVIVAPSVHASGAAYAFAGDWTVARERVPRFWPGWLVRPRRAPAPPPRRTPPPSGAIVTRARAYLEAIPKPAIGQGSDGAVLYAACRLVRGFGLSAADAETLLWDWAGGREGWTREWIAEKVAHAERYGTEPLGAFR